MRYFLAIIALLWASAAGASDFYYAQTAAGGNTGADCADAFAYTDATNGISTSGKWVAGNVLHICSEILGGNGSTLVTAAGNGSSGNVVTIKFETGGSLQAPYFSTNGAINLGSHSFVLVDGGTNGLIQATLNGTPGAACPGGACTQQQSTAGISSTGGNVEIKNLTFSDGYLHTSTSDTTVSNSGVNCVSFTGSNVLIHDNVAHDWSWCFYEPESAGDANVAIYNNNISRIDHAWALGPSGHSGGTNGPFSFHDNQVSSYANWDASGSYHHDGVHCFTSGTSGVGLHITGLNIYNNLFQGPVGSAITAHVFIEGGSGGSTTPCMDSTSTGFLYNNVFLTDSNANLNNGMAGVFSGGWSVYNNTMVGVSTTVGVGYAANSVVSSMTFENNVLTGFNQIIAITNSISFTPDHNIYANGGSNSFVCNSNFYNTSQFASWQSCIGGDTHSSYNSSAGLTSTGTVNSGSAVIGAGANLTSLAITALNSTTSAGNTVTPSARPSSAAWDVGAYEFTTPTAATPTFSPIAGSYSGSQNITIASTTGSATLCYRLDGGTPTAATAGTCDSNGGLEFTYSTPVTVSSSLTMTAIATESGFLNSAMGTAPYTITTGAANATAGAGAILGGGTKIQ